VTAGAEVLGLAAALLTQHTAALIAPVISVPDAETAPLMVTYHQQLLAGCSPAAALAEAQRRHAEDGPRARASAAAFICLGAGHEADVPSVPLPRPGVVDLRFPAVRVRERT
jgi:CHAT domain-containing protein